MIPGCLCESTSSICVPSIKRGGWIGFRTLRDARKASVLTGLKRTSHLLAHAIILSRSRLRSSAAVSGFSTTRNKLVSSAKRRILQPMSLTISLINRRKSYGPRIEP